VCWQASIVKEIKKVQEMNLLGEFRYEEDCLKELNFDKGEWEKVRRSRERQGEGKGWMYCPNRVDVRKYWWATRQETKASARISIN
jgi:hypothetical protein